MALAQHAVTFTLEPATAEQRRRLEEACAELLAVSPRSDLPGKMENRRAYGVLHTEWQYHKAISEIEQATQHAKGEGTNA